LSAKVVKDRKVIAAMFSSIAHRYDFVNRLLSFRQADKWRSRLIRGAELPERGLVLDVCTGSGDLALGFVRERPDFKGYVIGIDISAPMIDVARGRLAKLGPPYPRRVEFLMGDALDLEFADEKFDVVSAGFGVRNFADLGEGLKEMHRVLKVGGQANILEFFRSGTGFAPARWYSDNIVPLVGNMVTRTNAYTYLCRSINDFFSPEDFEEAMKAAGFRDIVWERMTFGIAYIVRGTKG